MSIDDIVKRAHENDPVEPIIPKPVKPEEKKEVDEDRIDFFELMKAIGIEEV